MDTILAGLADARALFEHGTMEERKRVVRTFVENLKVDGESGSGELRVKRIPDAQGIGDSFKVVAGTHCEVQQRNRPREIEVIPLAFTGQGATMMLAGVAIGAGASIIDPAPSTVPRATSRSIRREPVPPRPGRG